MQFMSQFSSKPSQWIYPLVRTALGMIFIWSGGSKLIEPRSFATIIEAYGLIPEATIMPAAFGLALLELVAGASLIPDLQGSLSIITGLLIFFVSVLAYGLWIGLDVDCGCFGPNDPEGAAYHSLRPALYRDMLMLTGTGFLYFWRWQQSIHPKKFSTVHRFYTNLRRRK